MAEYIDINEAWDESAITNWYCDSISQDDPPVWTSDHISELCKDFYVIPKEAPKADVMPVTHAHWTEKKATGGGTWDYYFICSKCGHKTPERGYTTAPDFCPGCGAVMDEQNKT